MNQDELNRMADELLADAEELDVLDRKNGETVSCKIGRKERQAFQRLCDKLGCTINEAMQMCIDVLRRYMEDRYNLSPEMQRIIDLFENPKKWKGHINLAETMSSKHAEAAIYFLRKEGDKGVRLVMVIGDAENMHREETVNQQDILNTFLKSYDERMYSKLLLVGRKIGTQSCDYVIRHLIDEYVPDSEDAAEIRQMFEDSRRSDFGRQMHEGGPYRRTMRNSMSYLDKKENKQLNLFGDGQDEDRNV